MPTYILCCVFSERLSGPIIKLCFLRSHSFARYFLCLETLLYLYFCLPSKLLLILSKLRQSALCWIKQKGCFLNPSLSSRVISFIIPSRYYPSQHSSYHFILQLLVCLCISSLSHSEFLEGKVCVPFNPQRLT